MLVNKSTLLHLRIPFSFFLMPVFCFAASMPPLADPWLLFLVFISLHLFLYPASNGYNSYYDKDEDSIGGLEKPPPVSKNLLYTSLIFDLIALIIGLFISMEFTLMLLTYGLVSKAYSHPFIRLKKYPIISLLAAAGFQGTFTFLMVYLALHDLNFFALYENEILFPAFISGVMILGFYPLTQVYQHAEDARRGDMTFSRMVGIMGTFHFSIAAFLVANALFYWYFTTQHELFYFLLFQVFMSPVLAYVIYWYLKVRKDESQASFKSAMLMNKLASACLIAFFVTFGVLKL